MAGVTSRCPVCGEPLRSWWDGFWHGLSGGVACFLYSRRVRAARRACDEKAKAFADRMMRELPETTDPPDLSDAAWKFLRSCALKIDGEFTTFSGDWGNWNYLFREMRKLSQGETDGG